MICYSRKIFFCGGLYLCFICFRHIIGPCLFELFPILFTARFNNKFCRKNIAKFGTKTVSTSSYLLIVIIKIGTCKQMSKYHSWDIHLFILMHFYGYAFTVIVHLSSKYQWSLHKLIRWPQSLNISSFSRFCFSLTRIIPSSGLISIFIVSIFLSLCLLSAALTKISSKIYNKISYFSKRIGNDRSQRQVKPFEVIEFTITL